MMGRQEEEGQEGIIPQICKDLFQRIRQHQNENIKFNVEVSFTLHSHTSVYVAASSNFLIFLFHFR